MREVRDAAAVDRAVSIVEAFGDLAFEKHNVPGNTHKKPQYFRGALVRSRRA